MSPVGVLYDQNSQISLYLSFYKNMICYKRGVFIKQEIVNLKKQILYNQKIFAVFQVYLRKIRKKVVDTQIFRYKNMNLKYANRNF